MKQRRHDVGHQMVIVQDSVVIEMPTVEVSSQFTDVSLTNVRPSYNMPSSH
jgi:uncharacterized protein YbbC (DUF1343 family)